MDVEELRRLEAAATPGPWEKLHEYWGQHSQAPFSEQDANEALIVAMRNALPELLDLLETRRVNIEADFQVIGDLQTERKVLRERVAELEQADLEACNLASRYGTIDGDHHKAWVIDQMVRKLTGNLYSEWLQLTNPEGDWSEGIAP